MSADLCHCGKPASCGFDGDPTHHRGMCTDCDAVRCDAYPGECSASRGVRESRTFTETERSTVAEEAQAAVYGDRGKDYGHPRENFSATAALWNALLADKLTEPVTAEDVARCMIGVKLARDLHSPKRDNRVDIIGYAITLDRLETGD